MIHCHAKKANKTSTSGRLVITLSINSTTVGIIGGTLNGLLRMVAMRPFDGNSDEGSSELSVEHPENFMLWLGAIQNSYEATYTKITELEEDLTTKDSNISQLKRDLEQIDELNQQLVTPDFSPR